MILQALKSVPPTPKNRKSIKDIEPDIFDSSNDVIWRAGQKQARRDRASRKPIDQWNSMDYMRFVDKLLRVYDLTLERFGFNDKNMMTKLYDLFVDRLDYKMNNMVLKDYLEWWVNCHATGMYGRNISVYTFMKPFYFEKFLTRFKTDNPKKDISDEIISDDSLYNLGGLSILIVTKGIVLAHDFLRKKSVEDREEQIKSALQSFSKGVLCETLRITTENAPYYKEQSINFLRLASEALKSHSIKQFDSIQYAECFSSHAHQ